MEILCVEITNFIIWDVIVSSFFENSLSVEKVSLTTLIKKVP